MITHLHSTTVVVSDQDAGIAFYTETLEWEKTTDSAMGPVQMMSLGKRATWFFDPEGNEYFLTEE